MLIAFLVIVIDIIGFGIMVPIFAFFPLSLGASPLVATLLMSLYTAAMFFSMPFLGRLSDYYGRRPVLMLSMLGATAGYLLLANAHSLWMIALARLLAGAMAGNLAAAQAYMTDITGEKNRSKAMGLIGAAFGLGFIIGPMTGSWLAGSDFETANLALAAYASAAMSGLAFLAVLFALPESLDKEHRDQLRAQLRRSRLAEFAEVMGRPHTRNVIFCGLLVGVTAGLFESIFPIWASDLGAGLVDGPSGLIPFLMAGGIAMVVVQGGLVGPLTRRFGEHAVLKVAACTYGLGLLSMSVAADFHSIVLVCVFMAVTSASSALALTCTQSLVSMQAGQAERGLVMGVFSSVGTFGRASATMLTGVLFQYISVHAPLYAGALTMLLLLAMAMLVHRQWRQRNGVSGANVSQA